MNSAQLAHALAGRYTIGREVGAGGMATVYLAEDEKHGRKVAVKVLHPDLAAALGAERFLAEIKTTANLQHPHILPLHDSGEADGFLFYVMPYVEGETLRHRFEREGQLPIDDAVRIAKEVGSALDYAHRHGVIHRDIKPENILLHDGSALVADFGIALAVQSAGGQRLTQTGLSLGTPQYMSPEQAMGERSIGARSDVYALGAVLYEMLTGEPPYTGPSAQAIVARLLTEEPRSPAILRKTIPSNVVATVLKALEKLPADRFASAAELAAALGNPSFASAAAAPRFSRRASARVAAWLPWALVLLAAGFIMFDTLRPTPTPVRPAVQRFDFLLPDNAAWVDEPGSGVALSPDGTMLAYTGRDSSGQQRVYLRAMDRLDPVPISGSESGGIPFFSPDGRWIGYIGNSGIVKAPLSGGSPERVCRTFGYVSETWLESNVIVFADGTGGLRQCSMSGQLTTLLANDSTESFNFPHGLPGDRGVLFSIRRGSMDRLAVLDLRTKGVKSLDIPGTDPRYVATGHVAYVSSDGLVRAVPFDTVALAPTGEPVIIAEGVRVAVGGRAMMALSRTGTIVAAADAASRRTLELVDRGGRAERLSPRLGEFLDPRFSPDGRRIAVSLGANIWLLDRNQGALTRLSFDSSASRPVWSRDGRHVAYVRQIGASVDLRLVNADGSAPAELLLAMTGYGVWEGLFTPDGRSLVVRTVGGPGSRELWRVALDSARQPVPLIRSPADEVSPTLSPDSRWLAYASNESGRYEVYVRSFPGMGARYPVSLDGGTVPVWSPRGGELFYQSGSMMLAAEVDVVGSTFNVLRRTALFSNGDYVSDPTHPGYDVAPDGRHFVMVRNPSGTSRLTVTLNQFQNLGQESPGAAKAALPR